METKEKIPSDLLKALNYSNLEEAGLDMIILSARSRLSEFSQEVKRFEERYGMDFDAFQKIVTTRVNEEDFAQDEDLMAWKFAKEATEYWQDKIEELEIATRSG